jgi:hypothetical protein
VTKRSAFRDKARKIVAEVRPETFSVFWDNESMRIDPEYLKQLLTAFQDSPNTFTDIRELEEGGIDYQATVFEFHLLALGDQGFIAGTSGRAELGMSYGAGGDLMWSVVPLRLTAQGQAFSDAINHSEIMATIKEKFIGASISTIATAAFAMLKAETIAHLPKHLLP